MKKIVLLAFVSMLIVSSSIIANASSEPRLIWSSGTINGTIDLGLQVIPDVNGDDHEDVFVASTPGGRTYDGEIVYSVYLALIDGKSGSIIRASDPINYSNMYPGSVAVYMNGYIVLAIVTEKVEVYNLQFNKVYSIPITPPADIWCDGWIPQTFDGTDLAFSYNVDTYPGEGYVKSHFLSNGQKKWNISYSGERPSPANELVYHFLVLSPQRAVYTYKEGILGHGSGWRLVLIDNIGNELDSSCVIGGSNDKLHLNPYNQTHFLYTKANDTTTVLGLASMIGDTVEPVWQSQTDRAYEGNKGFVVSDTNGDGTNEVIAVYNGNVTLYDGATGSLLYETTISEDGIRDVAVVSDIDGDEINEVLVLGWARSYFVSFKSSTYTLHWNHTWSEDALWHHGPIETIQDTNEDELKDVLVPFEGKRLTIIPCFSVSLSYTDDRDEFLDKLFDEDLI